MQPLFQTLKSLFYSSGLSPAATTVGHDPLIHAYLRRHKRTANALYSTNFLERYKKAMLALKKFYEKPSAKDLINTKYDNFRYGMKGSPHPLAGGTFIPFLCFQFGLTAVQ